MGLAARRRPSSKGVGLVAGHVSSASFFLPNAGAEPAEAGVKLAKQGAGRPNVIGLTGSFPGRPLPAMAMTTSKTAYRSGHAPLPGGIFVPPFPAAIDHGGDET